MAGPFNRGNGGQPAPQPQPSTPSTAQPFAVGASLQNNAASWVMVGGVALVLAASYTRLGKDFFLSFVNPKAASNSSFGANLVLGGLVVLVLTLIASIGPDGASFALVLLAALWLAFLYSTYDRWSAWLAKAQAAAQPGKK